MPVSDKLAFADLTTLSRGLADGAYTSVELTSFFLDRCRRFNPELNAVVTLLADDAMRQAAECDRERKNGQVRSPLHGLPYGAKDLFAAPGGPTTWGAPPYRDRVIPGEAAVLKTLREAGAILIAKLSMVEIAGGMGYMSADASLTGAGRNPWNPERWSGGSSSGCGSALAAGLMPFAIGTETWGSITSPAGNCGVTGMRPTYDTVSREGGMTLAWTLDKVGPFTREARDTGTILSVIRSENKEQNISQPVLDRPRIGLVRGALDHVQPEIAECFRESVKVLEKHATLVEVELPDLPYNAVADLIIACEAAAAHEDLVRSGQVSELRAQADRWRVYPDLVIPAVDYIQALRVRTVMQREIDRLMTTVDVLASPTLASTSCPVDTRFADWNKGWSLPQISAASNLCGLPAITVLNGFAADDLPSGLQLVGAIGGDMTLIALAQKYQDESGWNRQIPDRYVAK